MKFRRKLTKQLPIHSRHLGLNALARVKINVLKKRLLLLLAIRRKIQSTGCLYSEPLKNANVLIALLLKQYHDLVFVDSDAVLSVRKRMTIRKIVTIDQFPEEKIRENFRFTSHQQLLDIIQFFQLPEKIRLNNGCVVSSQTVLMISLFKFHYPENYNDLEAVFGYDYTICSRVFNFFLDFMTEHWGYLLLNNLQFWQKSFPKFAKAIEDRKEHLNVIDPFSTMDAFANSKIIGFLDATYFYFCQPEDYELQQSVYSGYKKQFGIKFQVAVLPNGMKLHVHSAESARRHDSFILNQSNLLNHLAANQLNSQDKFRLHGDPAYGALPPFLSSGGLGRVRVLVEQDFGESKEFFKMVTFKRALQLGCEQVVKIYFISFLLHDIFIIFNGSKVGTCCQCLPPTIEDYVSQGKKKINLIAD